MDGVIYIMKETKSKKRWKRGERSDEWQLNKIIVVEAPFSASSRSLYIEFGPNFFVAEIFCDNVISP